MAKIYNQMIVDCKVNNRISIMKPDLTIEVWLPYKGIGLIT